MGLPINDAAMIVEISKNLQTKNKAICLGEPLLPFSFTMLIDYCQKINVDTSQFDKPISKDKNISAEAFFKWIGFANYASVDVSPYEGAEIIHNLNDNELIETNHRIADLIFDGGTLEHVFHLPNALKSIYLMLKNGGIIIHHNPTNGYLDHGFYQICPTFYYDYYTANKYENISGNILNRYKGELSSEPYIMDIYRKKGMLYSAKKLPRATLFFCATKTEESTYNATPIQSYYNEMHSDFVQDYDNKYPFTYSTSSIKDKIYHYFPKLFKTIKKIVLNK